MITSMLSENETKLEERKTFYANRQLEVQAFYRNGKLEGESKSWHENGQLNEREFYRDGKREGEYKWWYENGQLRGRAFFRDGEFIDSFNRAKKKVFLRVR